QRAVQASSGVSAVEPANWITLAPVGQPGQGMEADQSRFAVGYPMHPGEQADAAGIATPADGTAQIHGASVRYSRPAISRAQASGLSALSAMSPKTSVSAAVASGGRSSS